MRVIADGSVSMKMISTTLRIGVQKKDDGKLEYASGFLFDFLGKGDLSGMAVITNGHVLMQKNGCPPKAVALDYAVNVGGKRVIKSYEFENPLASIILHPIDNVDLAALSLRDLPEAGVLDHFALSKDNLPDKKMLDEMDAIVDVLMTGYPAGLMHVGANLPLTRAGITAVPYFVDYDNGHSKTDDAKAGPSDFILDIGGFKGSSGSPVFLDHRDSGAITLLGVNKQCRFEQLPLEGVGEDGKKPFSKHPIHLAVCVKAHEVLAMGECLDNLGSTGDWARKATADDYECW